MKLFILRLTLLSALVFTVSCSSSHKLTTNTPATSTNNSMPLLGTEWLLTEIAGSPVVANSKASIAFLDGGRAAGNASCNRFTGTVEIAGTSLKFGPMASTRMACVDADISAQEDQYLKILAAAKRYERKDGSLLIFADGFDKPLVFSLRTAVKP